MIYTYYLGPREGFIPHLWTKSNNLISSWKSLSCWSYIDWIESCSLKGCLCIKIRTFCKALMISGEELVLRKKCNFYNWLSLPTMLKMKLLINNLLFQWSHGAWGFLQLLPLPVNIPACLCQRWEGQFGNGIQCHIGSENLKRIKKLVLCWQVFLYL